MNRTHDYTALHDQFVAGDMSLRELCRMNNIKNSSAVTGFAQRNHWADDRAKLQARATDKTIERTAEAQARRRERAMEVTDHAFDAVDKVLTKLVKDMDAVIVVERKQLDGTVALVEEPVMRVTPQAAAAIIDRLNVLLGRPSSITEERVSGDFNFNALPVDVLEAIADAAGSRAAPRRVAGSPIPRLAGPSETDG